MQKLNGSKPTCKLIHSSHTIALKKYNEISDHAIEIVKLVMAIGVIDEQIKQALQFNRSTVKRSPIECASVLGSFHGRLEYW